MRRDDVFNGEEDYGMFGWWGRSKGRYSDQSRIGLGVKVMMVRNGVGEETK